MMRADAPPRWSRWTGWLLAILVLVAPVDGLMHLVEEATDASAAAAIGTASHDGGPVLDEFCAGGPCEHPEHDHHRHEHCPSTCARCISLFGTAAPPRSTLASAPVLPFTGRLSASDFASPASSTLRLPPPTGPPEPLQEVVTG